MNCSATANASSATESKGPCVYCWCMLVLAYIPIITVTVAVLVAVISAKSVPSAIRIVLANILAASLTTILGTVMAFGNRAILTSTDHLCPSDTACRVYYWLINTGGSARLSFMATFTVVVFVIIKCSTTAIRPIFLILSVIAIWIIVFAFNAQLFSSQIVVSHFLDSSGCVPRLSMSVGFVYAVPYLIVFALIPVNLAISLPCATICFIRKNTQKRENGILTKAMVKFTLFLLLGNTIGVLGQSTPILFALISKEGGAISNDGLSEAINYVNGILLTASFVPTPILIVVYFKHVRKQLRKCLVWMLKCVRREQDMAVPSFVKSS